MNTKKTLKRSRSKIDIHSAEVEITKRAQKRSMPKKTEKELLNEFIIESVQLSETPLHPWKDTNTWEVIPRGKYLICYVRMLGKKKVTIYLNNDKKWQYIYDGQYSTRSYTSIGTVLDISYEVLQQEIVKYIK
jgi:hypothetical protein